MTGRGRSNAFAERLDLALRARGLALTRVAHYLTQEGLPITASTLSYWRRGRSLPRLGADDPAVAALERILETPADSLRGTLRRGSPVEAVRPTPSSAAVEVLFSLIECTWSPTNVVVRRHFVIVARRHASRWSPPVSLWFGNAPEDSHQPADNTGPGNLVDGAWIPAGSSLDPQAWTPLDQECAFARTLEVDETHVVRDEVVLDHAGAPAFAVELASGAAVSISMVDIGLTTDAVAAYTQYRRVSGEPAPRIIGQASASNHFQAGFRDPLPGSCGVFCRVRAPQ